MVVAVDGGGPGNRTDTIHYRGSNVQRRCVEHGRVHADGGYRGITELHTPTFAGGRIVRDAAWRRHRRRRARAEHCIARLKDWTSSETTDAVDTTWPTPPKRSPTSTISASQPANREVSGDLEGRDTWSPGDADSATSPDVHPGGADMPP